MPVPDNYIMPFGKYKGQEIGSVPASYLDWVAGQSWKWQWPKIVEYVNENRDHIDRELDLED